MNYDFEDAARELLGLNLTEIKRLQETEAGKVYLDCMAFTAIRADQIVSTLVEIGTKFAALEQRVEALEKRRLTL